MYWMLKVYLKIIRKYNIQYTIIIFIPSDVFAGEICDVGASGFCPRYVVAIPFALVKRTDMTFR